jgi:hypothetical protein
VAESCNVFCKISYEKLPLLHKTHITCDSAIGDRNFFLDIVLGKLLSAVSLRDAVDVSEELLKIISVAEARILKTHPDGLATAVDV